MSVSRRLRDRYQSLWDRALEVRWFRRTFMTFAALAMAAYPVWITWLLAVERDFRVETLVPLAVTAAMWSPAVLVVGAVLPEIGRRRVEVLVALVPVVGAVFLVPWFWAFGDRLRSRAEREAECERLLEGFGEFEREVFRLRFDPDEGHHLSRRATARRLGVTEEQVTEAEGRIEAKGRGNPAGSDG